MVPIDLIDGFYIYIIYFWVVHLILMLLGLISSWHTRNFMFIYWFLHLVKFCAPSVCRNSGQGVSRFIGELCILLFRFTEYYSRFCYSLRLDCVLVYFVVNFMLISLSSQIKSSTLVFGMLQTRSAISFLGHNQRSKSHHGN